MKEKDMAQQTIRSEHIRLIGLEYLTVKVEKKKKKNPPTQKS